MSDNAWSPIRFFGANGTAPFVLICEHAARDIPPEYEGLGLDEKTRTSHAAWDIGALSVATKLSKKLGAPLVSGGISRLVYDLNRPLDAPDAMPMKSEIFAIPGNENLTEAARQDRFSLVHEPFHCAVEQMIDRQAAKLQAKPIIITIHSFTPVYQGVKRDVEIGFLHHENAAFSEVMQAIEAESGTYVTALNEPYDADDGVTYSLRRHAEDRGFDNTMIEIRNDLIRTDEQTEAMARHLHQSILKAQAMMEDRIPQAVTAGGQA